MTLANSLASHWLSQLFLKQREERVDLQHPNRPIFSHHAQCPTSQQVYDSISQVKCDRLGAGDSGAATRNILGRDTKQAAALPHQHVLAVTEERVVATIERHVVWVTGCQAHTSTGWLAAVPAALLTNTAGKDVKLLIQLHSKERKIAQKDGAPMTICCSL